VRVCSSAFAYAPNLLRFGQSLAHESPLHGWRLLTEGLSLPPRWAEAFILGAATLSVEDGDGVLTLGEAVCCARCGRAIYLTDSTVRQYPHWYCSDYCAKMREDDDE
jgi:hypothetical protein